MLKLVNMISKQFYLPQGKICARLKCELCEIQFKDESGLKPSTRKQFGAMNDKKNTTNPGLGALNAIQYGIAMQSMTHIGTRSISQNMVFFNPHLRKKTHQNTIIKNNIVKHVSQDLCDIVSSRIMEIQTIGW